ncbi:hypothetical protein CARUB_v10009595mg [Capsella rubella]|uniref:DUF1664 domain-containing protein n=1 Tax=Capsella rubella TaxID=81985 RepID=R0II59_9BRAS|nr:uncharacterized protein LOC17898061 [Capsella rubella]EOA38125.1 hypothetical protein CARUB_v10009595mg [Capsella rubella]
MALPLGKLTILIGAGLVGSAFAKEGGLLDVSSLVSGAVKMVFRQLKQEEPSKSASNPRDDVLAAQVNSIRHEIQLLSSNRPITIVTTPGSGGRKYGLIIIVGVIGYGYVWWKGWKLPDLMFATRRSLSDACNKVDKQIDGFHSSLSGTRQELSSNVGRIGCRLDANMEVIEETERGVTELRDVTTVIKDDIKSVFDAVETLANKVYRIEGNQDITLRGVGALHAQCRENQRMQESNQALPSTSSLPALEGAPITPSSRTLSLPPVSPDESQSPSTPKGAKQSHSPLQHTQSMSGLKDISESSISRETLSNGTSSGGNGVSGMSSGMLSRFSIPRIVRSRTTVNTVVPTKY